jgi:hypothetical protein
MKYFFTFFLVLYVGIIHAQVTWNFEEFDLPENTYLNDAGNEGGFTNGLVFLPNYYDSEFFYWTGWAVSNVTDKTTPGFGNQYSAIPGSGYNGSKHYVVNSAFGNNNMVLHNEAVGKPVSGMYITNSTYAYLSMKDGDAFAKKFGGVTGNDPDYFLLTIKAFSEGNIKSDSVNFYLADYRFSNNNQDYIVKTWEWVDLSSLGNVDSLSFTLSSSDTGQFGMNTPAYFCVDNIITSGTSNTTINQENMNAIVFPNPAVDFIQIILEESQFLPIEIYDTSGKCIHRSTLNGHRFDVDVSGWQKGLYMVNIAYKTNLKFIKE